MPKQKYSCQAGNEESWIQFYKKLAISFSGGETSAYMTKLLLDKYQGSEIEVQVTFANTGQENEETLEFINECDHYFGFNTEWIEAVVNPGSGNGTTHKVVDFATASRNGEPFEALIAKYGIPNTTFQPCTRELKGAALRSARRDWGKYVTAIGIRADEFDRANASAEQELLYYPLINAGITKPMINEWWADQPFRLNLKGYQGNCKWCWKKSFRKLATIAKETPGAFDFPRKMEQKYENFRPETQPNRPLPARFFRNHKTVGDIFEMADSPDFHPAHDDSKILPPRFSQLELFDLDIQSGCSESCEAF